jgi:hypothetical protein
VVPRNKDRAIPNFVPNPATVLLSYAGHFQFLKDLQHDYLQIPSTHKDPQQLYKADFLDDVAMLALAVATPETLAYNHRQYDVRDDQSDYS